MIDLHVHTNHSDGTDSVEELLKNAERKKLDIISITDHDSVDAYFELEKKPELRKLYSGQIIVGIELKTTYNKVPIEILGYGIDYKKIKISKVDYHTRQVENLTKFRKIADQLGFKYDIKELYIDKNDPFKQYASHTFAREILKHLKENATIIDKIGSFTPESFFRVHQSNKNSIFFIDESEFSPSINIIIDNIHEAGGLAFLAHGFIYPFDNKIRNDRRDINNN